MKKFLPLMIFLITFSVQAEEIKPGITKFHLLYAFVGSELRGNKSLFDELIYITDKDPERGKSIGMFWHRQAFRYCSSYVNETLERHVSQIADAKDEDRQKKIEDMNEVIDSCYKYYYFNNRKKIDLTINNTYLLLKSKESFWYKIFYYLRVE